MKKLLRKALVIVVLFAPLFVSTDCKKQKKCGCRGDVLNEYYYSSYVIFDDESPTITMQIVGNYTDFYTVCNPDEIKPKLANFKSGDVLVVSGNVYWDCNYVWNSSNSGQSSYYRSFNIDVKDIFMNMYGKDDIEETLERAQ